MIIDSHCHVLSGEYDDIEAVIKRAKLNILIISGANIETSREAITLSEKYDNVYATIGIHPEYANTVGKEDLLFLENNINHPKVVAIGEIGLDYYWESDNKDVQKELFEYQIKIASKYHKGIVVHSREAIQDTYDIIKKYPGIKADIHCYGGSVEMAHAFIKLGCKLGIGGVLTFKNGKKMQEVVESCPLSSFLLETDSPYLAPEPMRGSKNEPCNIFYIANKIAEIKGITVEEVIRVTNQSSISQFDLKCELC